MNGDLQGLGVDVCVLGFSCYSNGGEFGTSLSSDTPKEIYVRFLDL